MQGSIFSMPYPSVALPPQPGYQQNWDATTQTLRIEVPNGEALFIPQCFSSAECENHLSYLLAVQNGEDLRKCPLRELNPQQLDWKNIAWKHEAILMFGRKVMQPRFTAWYGDPEKSYRYSGLTMHPEAWNEGLLEIKSKVEAHSDSQYNSVLLNWYRDGQDHMGWHSDDERELGQNPIIASVNYGAARRFLFRHKKHHEERFEILLTPGSLLVMRGEMQHFWQHALPKQTRVAELRVNLTFRNIK